MDLLGSIMEKMDRHRPPSVSDEQKKAMKKQRENIIKRQEEERSKLTNFKKDMESKMNDFVQDNITEKITLEPMNKMQRSIVHEIAEIAGLSAFSFGEEDIDRHVVIYKKEFTPSPEELNALRKGQTWNPESVAQEACSTTENINEKPNSLKKDSAPPLYLNKYERLIGEKTVKEAAKVTQVNRKYGFVSSENKKDQRSIEQTLADIRAKKKQKIDN